MTINYQYSNMLNAGSFGLNVLSPDDIELIHMSTLDVLWKKMRFIQHRQPIAPMRSILITITFQGVKKQGLSILEKPRN